MLGQQLLHLWKRYKNIPHILDIMFTGTANMIY